MPTEVHEHFDTDGNLTGRTVTTRESEWDDQTRNRVLELDAYEALLCGCGCGLPMTEAHRKQPFLVDVVTCEATRAMEKFKDAERDRAKREKWPEGWERGRHYFVRVPDKKED